MAKQYDLAAARGAEIINDIQSHLEKVKLSEPIKDYYQRTSTPILERRRCTIQESRKDGYEKWRVRLEESKPTFKVRGISLQLKDIISGNLIPFTNETNHEESETDTCGTNPANQRLDCHSDTMKKLLLSVVSDHCKSLLKRTIHLVKLNDGTERLRSNLK